MMVEILYLGLYVSLVILGYGILWRVENGKADFFTGDTYFFLTPKQKMYFLLTIILFIGRVRILTLSLVLVMACMGICALTDLQNCYVYDVVVLTGILFVILMLLINGSEGKIGEWLTFSILQKVLFSKLYGEGDVLIFLLIGSLYFALGKGLFDMVVFMALAFSLLAVIQFLKGNISRSGNLKAPVPLVPYLVVILWVCM